MREDRRLSRGISGTKNAMVHNGKMIIIVKYIEIYTLKNAMELLDFPLRNTSLMSKKIR